MSSVSLAVRKVNRRGFIKIAVDAEAKQILGAAILGTGGEVIHMALDIMYAKAPYTTVQRAMHAHIFRILVSKRSRPRTALNGPSLLR